MTHACHAGALLECMHMPICKPIRRKIPSDSSISVELYQEKGSAERVHRCYAEVRS